MQAGSRQTEPARPRIGQRYKLVASYVAVALGATLLAKAIVFGTRLVLTEPPLPQRSAGGSIALESTLVTLMALLLGLWASHRLAHRLQRMLDACRAWLRGNLSLRIHDPAGDEMGALARELDILVEHLERDEQDLDELRDYTARVTDQVRALAVDEERDRLARELHDGVKQHLFSLSMTASAIRTCLEGQPTHSAGLQEMAQELETTSKTVQRELTRLIDNLRPGTLEEEGLAAALNDYTLLFGAREHILVYLDVQGNDALLPPSVAESLYRVAQEALHNVARHARATRVDVRLRCLSEQATLALSDNGVGFDLTQARRGLGLGNMQDRMMSIGGRLTIDSKPGAGTTVRAEVGLTRTQDVQTDLTRTDKDSPNPAIENWAWLGQKLVIPVGQTWPWLPADLTHLRHPLIDPGQVPLCAQVGTGILGRKQVRFLQREPSGKPWLRIRHHRSGYEWKFDDATWTLEHLRMPGWTRRAVLLRNEQPLAAMQPQGRLLSTWTEIVYDQRGYRLAQNKDHPSSYLLVNRSGEELVAIERGPMLSIRLSRALPFPLLVMVTLQVASEASTAMQSTESVEASL